MVLNDSNEVRKGFSEGGDRSDPHPAKDGGNRRKGEFQMFAGVASDVVGAFRGVLGGPKNGPEVGEEVLAVLVVIDQLNGGEEGSGLLVKEDRLLRGDGVGGATRAPTLHGFRAVVVLDISEGVAAVLEDGAKVVLFRAVLKFAVRPQNAAQVGVDHDGGVGCVGL